jgi:UDP-N-acetylglucosamine acyltransferase
MTLAVSELIHPTAIVGPEVELAHDVVVGPYAILEGPIRVGPGCVIEAHACLTGPLELGPDNVVGHGAVLGKSPQSRGYRGESTRLVIGEGNTFREYVTVHRGTSEGGGVTRIGDRNMLMIGAHVGHDVQMGDDCTIVNCALVAGHAQLGDGCILSGHTAVQQRVRIGRLAMLGGMGASSKDIPPFILQQGFNCVTGLNVVGLRRAGIPAPTIDALRQSFRILYKEGRPLQASLERIEADFGHHAEIREFAGFIRQSKNGINPARDNGRRSWALK